MILLCIDIQKGITGDRLYDFDTFRTNTLALIAAARESGVEIIHFQHDDGPGTGFSVGDDDFEYAPGFAPADGERHYIKTINSCFGNKEFAAYLEGTGEDTLMIVGLQTNFCIDTTVRSAFERGYRVIIPDGTNSTFDNAYMAKQTTYRYYNEMMWPKRFAQCVTFEEALAMIRAH